MHTDQIDDTQPIQPVNDEAEPGQPERPLPRRRDVAERLRGWSRHQPRYVAAAVELLIQHGVWLTRDDFTASCLHADPDTGMFTVGWAEISALADTAEGASETDVAVLRFAVDLAGDKYRLRCVDPMGRYLMASALLHALDVAGDRAA